MKTVTILTREQIEKLNEILVNFKDIPQFDIVEKNTNGIGPSMFVQFNQGNLPVLIDITDVSNW